ncbi:MAG: hypothetical protein JXA42_15345 [Anaerolineales bacterium]|nr:hypothetical protein [Anaerolineales bacterium]
MINPRDIKRATLLNQKKSVWLCSVRRSPIWITPRNAPYLRPYIVLVMDADADLVRHTESIEEYPTTDELMNHILRAMLKPMSSSGRRCRPEMIAIDDRNMVEALADRLSELNVRCEYRVAMNLIDKALLSMAKDMRGGELPPALIDIPRVTVPLLEDFFKSADLFYRAAPWNLLSDDEPIEIEYDGMTRYAAIMGNAGVTFGLATYESKEDLDIIYSTDDPETTAKMASLTVTYDNPMFLSFRDLDEIEKRGWPVEEEEAYPLTIKIIPPGDIVTLSVDDLTFMAAALKALPDFISNHLCRDGETVSPAQCTYHLSGIHNNREISFTFPIDDFGDDLDIAFEIIEDFIDGWHDDDPETYHFSRLAGIVIISFLNRLEDEGFAYSTIDRHEKNCWYIGKFLCREHGNKFFSPELFMGPPRYVQEFAKEVSDAPSTIRSYQATWRKLARYVTLKEKVQIEFFNDLDDID